MLQSDALLPWLTIYENAILGLKIQNKITQENLDYVDYLFEFSHAHALNIHTTITNISAWALDNLKKKYLIGG